MDYVTQYLQAMQAGQAYGVYDGDQLTVYSFGSAEQDSRSVIAKVTHAEALTSDLEPLDAAPTVVQTERDAKALIPSSLALAAFFSRLFLLTISYCFHVKKRAMRAMTKPAIA
jgi:hypothetical protein